MTSWFRNAVRFAFRRALDALERMPSVTSRLGNSKAFGIRIRVSACTGNGSCIALVCAPLTCSKNSAANILQGGTGTRIVGGFRGNLLPYNLSIAGYPEM
jgi:hypothetical protein